MISDKANDLINLARETLGADFLLPHFLSILKSYKPKNFLFRSHGCINKRITIFDET